MLVPVRTDDIRLIAEHFKNKYRGYTIDEVAADEDIILVRMPDTLAKKAGYAVSAPVGVRRKRIPSLVHPGRMIISYTEWEQIYQDCIVINTAYNTENAENEMCKSGAPNENEVFWHEFYHVRYSPTENTSQTKGAYSMIGVRTAQEERRANTFAALMTIGDISDCHTIEDVMRKWGVTREVAKCIPSRP
jgi:hypothetical protein